ncbi:arylesterase [Aureimonas frigidaquae]|uniref:arylesterase n=1 Tax=Aureimonas frigidaquae TaxID=424757 RepID=UPI0007845ACF|nr:arylesterase [Aureimonas frigidaquae]
MRQIHSPLAVAAAVFALITQIFVPTAGWAQTPTTQIVAFGDSLSAGYGLGPGEAFPDQLEAALAAKGYAVSVANAGVSGDTTTGGLARLDWSVPEASDLVIVELGANDALRGIDPALTRRNLTAIVERLKSRSGTTVLLTGMIAPPNMGPAFAESYNPIFPEIAREQGVAFYPFFLDGVAGVTRLNQADYMHPTKEGIAEIVQRMLPQVEEVLAGMGVRPGGAQ